MDDSTAMVEILVLVVLIILSAFFSATETAFTSLNRIRLKNKADNGDKKAAKALKLAEQYDKFISSTLIGNNIANNAATTISTLLFIKLLGSARGPAISTVVVTVVILIFGEITPKSLAKESPEKFAMFAAPVMRLIMFVLTPISFLFAQWKKLLSNVFKKGEDDGITEEELVTIVDQAETEGGLDAHESQLIRAAIEFNDLEVEEILTPRVDIVALAEDATVEEVAAIFAESGFSRLPVYKSTVDNIIGVVHEKDFYAARYRGKAALKDIMSCVLYTTANTKISNLLRILQTDKSHIAVVVDEYGGTEGIVTLEDILEELVGEIWDEHDEVIEEFKPQPDGSYLIACSANLDDLFDLFALKGEYDSTTVSGWVMEQVERVPKEGDKFESEGLDVTVTRVEDRRILEILVRVLDEDESADEDESEDT